MTLVQKNGNLFDSTAEALAHGVNTKGLMGAGIAVEFKHRNPEMYAAYKVLCRQGKLDAGEVWTWDARMSSTPRWIYNIASQDQPGANARLEWFERGITRMIKHAQENGVKRIAMPRIGCGIGGLDWADVYDILDHYIEQIPLAVEVWSL